MSASSPNQRRIEDHTPNSNSNASSSERGPRPSGERSAEGGHPAGDASGSGERAAGGERPMGGPGGRQLPPEIAEKLAKMTPEERAAFMAQRRAEREARRAAEGNAPAAPAN